MDETWPMTHCCNTTMSAPPADPVTTLENANGTTETSSTTLPHAKLSAIHRFKSLTTSGFGSSDASPGFPPASWSLSQSPDSGSGASNWSSEVEKWKLDLERWKEQMKNGLSGFTIPTAKQPSVANDIEEEASTTDSKGKGKANVPPSPDGSGDVGTKDAPEPSTLAMRIKALIDENFTFASTSKSSSTGSHSEPSTPGPSNSTTSEVKGTLTPKPEGSADSNRSMFGIADSKLARLLSSESMMNGGIENGKESVWAILDRMRYRKNSKGKERDDDPPDGVQEDGIMFYTPLQPTTELSPEIAESVLEDDDSTSYYSAVSPPTSPPDKASELNNPPSERSTPQSKTKRVFQPSATTLSVQCTWWGYRLFIPPPVMAQLSNTHIAAAKRGAMITAALKWLVDKAPLMMIPPQLRPAMLLLKGFSPYLGYIGAFVAWSWGRVESKDTGNGVVLTATWLLPIAILPASWDFNVHGVPVQSTADNVSGGEATSTKESGGGISTANRAAFTSPATVRDAKANPPSQTTNNSDSPTRPLNTSNKDSKASAPARDNIARPVAIKRAESSINRTAPSSSLASAGGETKDMSSFRKAVSRKDTASSDAKPTSTSAVQQSRMEGSTRSSSFARSVLRRATTSGDARPGITAISTNGKGRTSNTSIPSPRSLSRRATTSADEPSNDDKVKNERKD
ncbi:hypothetical protein E1B28_001657 [Marasmius oreades]|uniref:Uncharacterized protein n=1 Tax=Marasmius oreades TaxID=181124 RepID=A0A9P7V3V7_9AGAR|nr:uncharacterized protein E1B28_001657 [Marasmius oreades]KAG7099850.1 hypothetical protein E1B28_001657 [Marasmius oreades]